jgi:hypothetical protein
MKIRATFLALMFMLIPISCVPVKTPEPERATRAVTPDLLPPIATSTSNPTANPSPTCTLLPDYAGIFREALGTNGMQCLPDKTKQGIGLYVYDLDNEQELAAINADVPFLFASAFKGPLLVYFLKNCKKTWDTTSPEWKSNFLDGGATNNRWYTSEEYKYKLAVFLSDITNWDSIEDFALTNRAITNGEVGAEDQRYLILAQVRKMVTQSDNSAAGLVLNFVYENCLMDKSTNPIEQECWNPNAISEFNQWFDNFSQIEYKADESRRGLYSFDIVTITDENGNPHDLRMPTYGQVDGCAKQHAFLDCSTDFPPQKAWTARDLFKFYHALFYMNDGEARAVSMEILKIDEPGNARGFLKNLARKMNAETMSKNGISSGVLADAGIMEYQGHFYVISTLSYNAVNSMITLYGAYNADGQPVGEQKGLLEELIEGSLFPK